MSTARTRSTGRGLAVKFRMYLTSFWRITFGRGELATIDGWGHKEPCMENKPTRGCLFRNSQRFSEAFRARASSSI